jgi:hypothetical protein
MPADVASAPQPSGTYRFEAETYDLIVVTQSCDLENNRAPLVAMCPIFALNVYEAANPGFARRGEWEKVRLGRVEGLHLLAALEDSANNRRALVADFHQIYSLPLGYLEQRAETLSNRHRLRSPYLEHFSQAFARFFMRVGLPSDIPRYS